MKQTLSVIFSVFLLHASWMASGCGEGIVDVTGRAYEPKIVIDGYLHPGSDKAEIFFRRNLALDDGTLYYPADLALPGAVATITDVASSVVYPLTFDPDSLYHHYTGTDLLIGNGKTYRLDVTATIDGRLLSAYAITTTPAAGFSIDRNSSVLDSLAYNAKDGNGNPLKFKIVFNRAPGTDFYMVAFKSLEASTKTFVYSPVNLFADLDSADVVDDIDDLSRGRDFELNTPLAAGKSSHEVQWYNTWFYGDYRAVVYAGDRNMRDFVLTFEDVQEFDGNLHEPVFYIKGDGIGVFGSAVTDTVFFRVVRPQ